MYIVNVRMCMAVAMLQSIACKNAMSCTLRANIMYIDNSNPLFTSFHLYMNILGFQIGDNGSRMHRSCSDLHRPRIQQTRAWAGRKCWFALLTQAQRHDASKTANEARFEKHQSFCALVAKDRRESATNAFNHRSQFAAGRTQRPQRQQQRGRHWRR